MTSASVALSGATVEGIERAAARGSFDGLSRVFHWTTVLLIGFLGATGYLVHFAPAFASGLLIWHRSAGVGVWFVTILRLAWRRTFARLPPFPESMGTLHRLTATASEYLLYVMLLAQPLTGLAATLTLGLPLKLVGVRVAPLMTENLPLSQALHELHEKGALALFSLIFIHASAALFHHYVLKDDILVTMLPRLGKRQCP